MVEILTSFIEIRCKIKHFFRYRCYKNEKNDFFLCIFLFSPIYIIYRKGISNASFSLETPLK